MCSIPRAVAAATILPLVLAACGGGSAESTPPSASAKESAAPPKAPSAEPAVPPEIVRDIARLSGGKPTERVEAAMRLEERGAAAAPAQEALLRALADDDPDVRAAAARAAAAAGPGSDAVRDALVPRATGDPDVGVRKAAIDGLKRFDSEVARAAVRKAIEDDLAAVRAHAIAALAESGDASSAPRIADALSDDDTTVVVAAVKALGHLRAERFAGEIGKLLASPDDGLKRDALAALEAIGTVDAESLPAVVECLASRRLPVRIQAIATLETVSGEKFPFDPDELDEATRTAQIERWREWLKAR